MIEVDSKNLKVNIDSLKQVSNELSKHNKNILDNLNMFYNDFSKISEAFDSKASQEYQRIMDDFLKQLIKFVNERNTYLVDKLNEINKTYWELFSEVKDSVGDESGDN